MSIGKSLVPEFEIEMAGTRRTIERIPDDKLDWKAHEKSNTIGWVANHLAEIPGWVVGTLTADTWDINPPDGEPYQTPDLRSVAEILESFDRNVKQATEKIKSTPDEEFGKMWSLLAAGEVLIRTPKANVMRTWVLNHTIHHRGILTVYLRLNDIPVPALYGPSGDESP